MSETPTLARFAVAAMVVSCARPPAPAPVPQAASRPSASVPVTVAALPVIAPPPSAAPALQPTPPPARPRHCVQTATRKERGVVPDELLDLLGTVVDVSPALEDAARCVTALNGDASVDSARSASCEWREPELLAADPDKGRVAVLLMPDKPTAGDEFECIEARLLTFDLASARTTVKTRWPWAHRCDGRGLAVSERVADSPREGFTVEARSLVTSRGSQAVGATAHYPVAVLDAPLCGLMLYVAGDNSVRLVTPENDASTPLGTLKVNGYPSIEEAVLSPGRKYLVLLVSATPGGHNLPLSFDVARFALPAKVKLADPHD